MIILPKFKSVHKILVLGSGAIKIGEAAEFEIERDENGELQTIMLDFRGETYSIDMDKLKELQELYRERKKEE